MFVFHPAMVEWNSDSYNRIFSVITKGFGLLVFVEQLVVTVGSVWCVYSVGAVGGITVGEEIAGG